MNTWASEGGRVGELKKFAVLRTLLILSALQEFYASFSWLMLLAEQTTTCNYLQTQCNLP